MASFKSFLPAFHLRVSAILVFAAALLAGCAGTARNLSSLPDTYATVFLTPVEVHYSGSGFLNAAAIAQGAGTGFARAFSEKGYTVIVSDSAISHELIEAAIALQRPGDTDPALAAKLQNTKEKGRKYYAVLKNGAVVDVLLDVNDFRSGLKPGSYVDARGRIQIVEPPELPAQYEESRQFGKSVSFEMNLESLDATGRTVTWTSTGGDSEAKFAASLGTLEPTQADALARQVLKALPDNKPVAGTPPKPGAK